MKKALAIALTVLVMLSLVACGGETAGENKTTEPEITGYLVPQPMTERPSYAVSENPTTQELRETAVRAMADMLSIQWSTENSFMYNKTGAVSEKDYRYEPETIYCGLPYADGQTNIYVWLEYYDYATGQLRMEGDGQWLNDTLGNTCAGSLMWAWSTVCDSLTGKFINTNMVPKYGCIPVGSYTCPAGAYMDSYYDYTTAKICGDNGLNVMFESYAQIKMADAVTSSTTEHTMMSTVDAVVVRDEDGTINGAESYIIVQDQAAGVGEKFYEHVDEEGNTYHYTGRTGPIALKCTFLWLYEKHYIPVTTAEFLGQEPYAKSEVSFSQEGCATVDDLCNGTFTANYPMCMLKIIATDAEGNKTALHTVYFDRYDVQGSEGGMMDGKARNYKVSGDRLTIETAFDGLEKGEYTVTAEVTSATGEVFTPVSFAYSK